MEQVKIGWASRDISTTKPVNIPGQFHMRISKGVMDPVTVNALVLDSGEDQAIFLSCDIVVLRNGLQDLVREKLAQCAPEIPAMKILMNATHTHNGPSLERGKRPFDYGMEVASSDENREFVAEMCVQAVREALERDYGVELLPLIEDQSLTRWFLWNETACLVLSSMGEDPDAQQVEIVVFLQNYQDYT